MNLNTCNFMKRIEQVLAELDISAIEDYVIIIIVYENWSGVLFSCTNKEIYLE